MDHTKFVQSMDKLINVMSKVETNLANGEILFLMNFLSISRSKLGNSENWAYENDDLKFT